MRDWFSSRRQAETCELTNKSFRKLIILGQVPPPFHGQAIAIKKMVDGLHGRLDLVHIPMNFSESVSDNGRLHFHKLLQLFRVIYQTLVVVASHPRAVLYFPPAPASWVPVLRDFFILLVVRPWVGKTVFHFHAHGIGGFLTSRGWLSFFRRAWSKPDLAIVLGDSGRQDVELLRPKELRVIPYGIDLEPTPRRRPSTEPVRILYVGMLHEEKGLFDLLETANALRDTNVEFRLVGTFKRVQCQDRFQDRMCELELEGIVRWIGQQTGKALWQEYADADIFFFPTYFETETFGLVTLEAMIHSLPVVASDWRGPRDIVQNEETGILCKPRSIQDYVTALDRLISDPELRAQMGSQGRQIGSSRYALHTCLHELECAFRQLGCGHFTDTE